METVANLTRQPFEATFAGKRHKFTPPSISVLFGHFERKVQTEWQERAVQLAEKLPEEKRYGFLSYQASHPLAKEEEVALTKSLMMSTEGAAMILNASHVVEDKDDVLPDVVKLVMNPVDKAELKRLMDEMSGVVGVKLGSDKTEGSEEDPKEK